MKISFQRRLFRLFLVASISPIILISMVGYYLMTEVSRSGSAAAVSNTELAEYYNNLIFARITSSIQAYQISEPSDLSAVDFLLRYEGGHVDAIKTNALLTPEIAQLLIGATTDRSHGFLESDRRMIQFASASRDSILLIGGIMHDDAYLGILGNVDQETASTSSWRMLRSEYLFFVLLVLVAASSLAAGGAWYMSGRLSRSMARPLQELTAAAEAIGTGQYGQTIEDESADEIGTLVKSFNRMSVKLDQTARLLAQTERVAAWRQVARRFAHELRNPLQPLLVSLYRIEKLLEHSEAYERIYEPLKAASEEVRHLTALAERFSHLARLPAPSIEEIDLAKLIDSVADLYRDQLADRNFIVVIPPGDMTVNSDSAYLREALHNLIQNSLDATKSGQRIEVRLAASNGNVLIIVNDAGIGMDPDIIAQARLPYFTTKEKGTGLGLAIVEKSIGELGGQLKVESEPGGGTTVTISLPQEDRTCQQESS